MTARFHLPLTTCDEDRMKKQERRCRNKCNIRALSRNHSVCVTRLDYYVKPQQISSNVCGTIWRNYNHALQANSTKSPASSADYVSKPRLTSKVGTVREVLCAWSVCFRILSNGDVSIGLLTYQLQVVCWRTINLTVILTQFLIHDRSNMNKI